MAFRRRRRKRQVNWFPVQFEETTGESGAFTGVQFEIPVEANGEFGLGVFPLTFDKPKEAAQFIADPDTSLADAIGSGYILRRLVGKLHMAMSQFQDEDPNFYAKSALVGAGFLVARADGTGQSPVAADYNPLSPNTMREPWIWRRTWFLSNALNAPTDEIPWYQVFPVSVQNQASGLDSGHIDAKTIRKVVDDNRLWFSIATLGWPETNPQSFGGNVGGWLDLRILGSLVRGRQQGAF